MPHQEPVTIVAKVAAERVPALRDVMETLRADPAHNEILPFGALPTCHFGRVLFLPESTDLHGKRIAPQLIVLSDCDGSADEHLEALVDVAGDGLDRLLVACEGYPERGATRDERLSFLREKSQRVQANYVHRQGRTVQQIKREDELREALRQFVKAQRFSDLSPAAARDQIRGFVERTPALSWALQKPERVGLGYQVKNALDFTTLPLGLVAFGPVIIPAALVLLLLVRLQEQRDVSDDERPTPEHVRALHELEDFVAHSGFTAGGFVKPGLVRRAVISSVLPLIGWGTRHLFTRESLAGVKSIHFARWIPLDEGRRVVFASNYDGSLESYNDDFIDLVSWGLNLVFSNGYGYPKTRWLVRGGAEREQEFKDYLRRHQIPTPVWYSAYPHLTAVNVAQNGELRRGLRGPMTERRAQRWLQLL